MILVVKLDLSLQFTIASFLEFLVLSFVGLLGLFKSFFTLIDFVFKVDFSVLNDLFDLRVIVFLLFFEILLSFGFKLIKFLNIGLIFS